MKRLFFVLTFALSLIAGGSISMATNISTLAGLQAMNANLAEDYILVKDIDASATSGWNSGAGFIPVGTNANKFTGSFDGQNHVINGLFINRPNTYYVGLFGYVVSAKDFKDVRLENCNITGKGVVGGLAGRLDNAVVSNCFVQGAISLASSATDWVSTLGGLIGFSILAQVSNCDFIGTVTTGNATGAGDDILKIGGLIGDLEKITVSNCHVKADLVIGTADDTYWIGGLHGKVGIELILSNCSFCGSITIGDVVDDCTNIGGLIGTNNDDCEISDCFAICDLYFGAIPGSAFYHGGLIGRCDKDTTIARCYSLGSLNFVGAIPGGLSSVGGLIGYNEANISESCSAVEIKVTGLVGDIDWIGGFIGENADVGVDQTISQCHSLGDITIGNITNDLDWTGGFIGWNGGDCAVSNCFAQGNLRAGNVGDDARRLGGLIGYNGATAPVSRCYSTGSINWAALGGAATDIGGLIGRNDSLALTTNCFWDTQTSGQAASAGGTGRTTAQMRTSSTFTSAGWNFSTIWRICGPPFYEPSYPYLQADGRCGLEDIPRLEEGNYQIRAGKYYIKCEADKQNLLECHFTLRQNGGCAEFSFAVGRPDYVINLGDEVLVYLYGQVTPWYRGRILERSVQGSSSRVRRYAGYGHFEWLSGGNLVNVNFAGTLLQTAIIQILDVYVRPFTTGMITPNNSKIANPGYTITQMNFDMVKPIDALTDLCELATGYEFGVDEAGDFYFRAESSAVLEHKWVGKHVATYLPVEDMRKLVNRWYLEGGTLAGGSNYDWTINNLASQGIYQIRSDKATIPSGMNTLEVQRWGTDLLAKTSSSTVKATISGIDIERTRTRIWPRGQMRLTSEDGLYPLNFPIRVVTYHITPKGITADVELGEKKPSLIDPITALGKQIKKEQEQLASDVRQLADGTGIMPDVITEGHLQPMPLVYLALFKDEL